MVPYRQSADPVLLPYERQLIEALGCTEEEYKQFVRHLRDKTYVRPAEYELVPDINNSGFEAALISIAVGALLQTAAYFLTPKPKAPVAQQSRDIQQQQLGGVSGASRFAPNYGFDSAQNLATYGTPVPIAFTKRVQVAGQTSGGVLISPALVWSRLKSWGNFQVIELVAVAGQGIMDRPDRSGLFLGNNAIDGVIEDGFQFYWNNGSTSNSRLYGRNLRYGTLSRPAIPAASEEAFVAPTTRGANDTGFCGAFTPTNQTRFGVYSGIPNGTPYRPNWEVSQPLSAQTGIAQKQVISNQRKFIDNLVQLQHPYGGGVLGSHEKAGMPGVGRNYARHVGIIRHNGYTVPDPTIQTIEGHPVFVGNFTAERTVNVGDIIEVVVGYGRQNREPFSPFGAESTPAQLDDVRSATDSEAEQFDTLLVRGQTYMIGRTLWQVTNRPNRVFRPGDQAITVQMKCVDAWTETRRRIGLVAPAILGAANAIYGEKDISEAFYPILRVDFAHVRNNRPCDVTEIGIRSQVWVRFNGITNFNSILPPNRLATLNTKDIQVKEGKNTSYARRTSFFAIDVRPANNENTRNSTRNDGFEFLGLFAVTGNSPQDIYSFIRIKHPQSGTAFEYRLRPFNSACFVVQSSGDVDVLEINGNTIPYQEYTVSTYLGTFTIGGRGKYIKPKDVYTHTQMVVRPDLLGSLVYGEWVDQVSGVQQLGITIVNTNTVFAPEKPASSVEISDLFSKITGVDPYAANLPTGSTRTISNWNYVEGEKRITMSINLRVASRAIPGEERNKWWEIVRTNLTSYVGTWNSGQTFVKTRSVDGVNQFRFQYRILTTSVYIPYDQPRSATRIFEQYSAVAEVSHYGDLITRSCDDGPEHQVVYVNESITEETLVKYDGLAVAGLKMRSSNSLQSMDQLRCYIREGVQVELLTDGGRGASNLFTDLVWYLATDKDIGVGGLISPDLLDRAELAATGRYLRANRLFFDDVIADPINLRSWIAEKAPSLLCYTVIKNGKLSVRPALPVAGDDRITTSAPRISAMFTDGNIIEDSFRLEWLDLEERKMFQAAVIFSRRPLNQLSRQETVLVRYNETGSADLPIEEFNLPHVSSVDHAVIAAKYFLALRKHVTHSVTFNTLPYGLALAPGDFIIVAVEMSPYNPANNGVVQPDGTIVSVLPLANGTYSVNAWERSSTQVVRTNLVVANGIATNLRNSVFSLATTNVTKMMYQVDALDVNEEGIVTIKATNFPVDSSNASLIAKDVLSTTAFTIISEAGGS